MAPLGRLLTRNRPRSDREVVPVAHEAETVYLASSFGLSERVQTVYEALTDAGHRVPDVWWNRDLKELDLPDEEWYEHPDVEAIAERHWESIENSGAYVLVCPADQSKKYNGANVEFGYAHAHGLDCYAVGALERSAMYVPMTRVDTVAELLAELGEPARN
jgi:hypothetical protein